MFLQKTTFFTIFPYFRNVCLSVCRLDSTLHNASARLPCLCVNARNCDESGVMLQNSVGRWSSDSHFLLFVQCPSRRRDLVPGANPRTSLTAFIWNILPTRRRLFSPIQSTQLISSLTACTVNTASEHFTALFKTVAVSLPVRAVSR
jgi:hypothetical protein